MDTLQLLKDIKKKRSPEYYLDTLFSKFEKTYNGMSHQTKYNLGGITYMTHTHFTTGASISVSLTHIVKPLQVKFNLSYKQCEDFIVEKYQEHFPSFGKPFYEVRMDDEETSKHWW